MTLSLIKSYGLLNDVTPIPARKATREELQTFHSQDYLEFCDKTTNNDDLEKLEIHSEHNFGIEYDCPQNKHIQWILRAATYQQLAKGTEHSRYTDKTISKQNLRNSVLDNA